MELLKRYKEEIGNDLLITDYNIKDIQLRLPSRKHFWAARLIDAKVELQALLKRKKTIKRSLVQKILQEAPVKLSQQAAESAAETTEDISTINDNIKEYEFVIEYLEKVEKIMQNMHWEIKNIIDIQRMEQL